MMLSQMFIQAIFVFEGSLAKPTRHLLSSHVLALVMSDSIVRCAEVFQAFQACCPSIRGLSNALLLETYQHKS